MQTYHWTTKDAAQAILAEGFRFDTEECGGRQWGRAIYLAADAQAWVEELQYVGVACEALLTVEIATDAKLFAMDGAGSSPRDILVAWATRQGYIANGAITDAGYAQADALGDTMVYGAANLLLAQALKDAGYDGLTATTQSGAFEVVVWNSSTIVNVSI